MNGITDPQPKKTGTAVNVDQMTAAIAALRRRGLDPADYTANMFEVRAGDNVYKRAPTPVTLWP